MSVLMSVLLYTQLSRLFFSLSFGTVVPGEKIAMNTASLYIGNLHENVNESLLAQLFTPFGMSRDHCYYDHSHTFNDNIKNDLLIAPKHKQMFLSLS